MVLLFVTAVPFLTSLKFLTSGQYLTRLCGLILNGKNPFPRLFISLSDIFVFQTAISAISPFIASGLDEFPCLPMYDTKLAFVDGVDDANVPVVTVPSFEKLYVPLDQLTAVQ